MPMHRRLPKHGFKNPFRIVFQVVNVSELDRFDNEVTREKLIVAGIVAKSKGPVKVLGNGEITKALQVHVDAASASAIEKIEAAGGKVILTQPLSE